MSAWMHPLQTWVDFAGNLASIVTLGLAAWWLLSRRVNAFLRVNEKIGIEWQPADWAVLDRLFLDEDGRTLRYRPDPSDWVGVIVVGTIDRVAADTGDSVRRRYQLTFSDEFRRMAHRGGVSPSDTLLGSLMWAVHMIRRARLADSLIRRPGSRRRYKRGIQETHWAYLEGDYEQHLKIWGGSKVVTSWKWKCARWMERIKFGVGKLLARARGKDRTDSQES